MRPKKIVLCIDPDPVALSLLSYALWVAGYHVFSAENATDALAIFANECVELVLCDSTSPLLNGIKTVGCMKGIARHIPMILLGQKKDVGSVHPADALLVKNLPMAELLERVRVMSARKRGPHKQEKRVPNPDYTSPAIEAAWTREAARA